MCDQCGPPDPEEVAAYAEFEKAVNIFVEKMKRVPENSIMIDWVLVSSRIIVGEHQNGEVIGYETALNQAVHRTTGLLHEVLDYRRSNDTANLTAHKLGEH